MCIYDQEITYRGRTQSITDWAYEIGLRPNSLYRRIAVMHWSVEKALSTPNFKSKRYNGKTLKQLEGETGIDRHVLWRRFNRSQNKDKLRPVEYRPQRIFGYWRDRLYHKVSGCCYPDCFHCPLDDCEM